MEPKGEETRKGLKIREVLAEKYGFVARSSPESPPLVMNEDLTVGELIEEHNVVKKESFKIGINITSSVVVLGKTKKISLISILLYNHTWIILLFISIGSFFVSWILGVVFALVTIKEVVSPFYRKALYTKIKKIVLTDYEAFYMLLCTNSISIRPNE